MTALQRSIITRILMRENIRLAAQQDALETRIATLENDRRAIRNALDEMNANPFELPDFVEPRQVQYLR